MRYYGTSHKVLSSARYHDRLELIIEIDLSNFIASFIVDLLRMSHRTPNVTNNMITMIQCVVHTIHYLLTGQS